MRLAKSVSFSVLGWVCFVGACDNAAPTNNVPPVIASMPAAGAVAPAPVTPVVPSTSAAAGAPAPANPATPVPAAGSGGTSAAGAPAPTAGTAGQAPSAAGTGGSGAAGAPAEPAAGSGDDPFADLFPVDPGTNSSATPPAAGMCADLFCFDIFDCAIFHPDEAATCNFTSCDNFVCK